MGYTENTGPKATATPPTFLVKAMSRQKETADTAPKENEMVTLQWKTAKGTLFKIQLHWEFLKAKDAQTVLGPLEAVEFLKNTKFL